MEKTNILRKIMVFIFNNLFLRTNEKKV